MRSSFQLEGLIVSPDFPFNPADADDPEACFFPIVPRQLRPGQPSIPYRT